MAVGLQLALLTSALVLLGSRAEQRHEHKYLQFPEGSNVQLIYCLTVGSFARPRGLFTLGVTAGLAYELPHAGMAQQQQQQRRQRRQLYRKLEGLLDTQGHDGRGCLLRALCRAGQRNRRRYSAKAAFLHEILHSVFTFPEDGDAKEDDAGGELTRLYQQAYDALDDCEQLFRADSCPWRF